MRAKSHCIARNSGMRRIPVAHSSAESPIVQASAPRVFHLNRHDLASWVIHLDGCAVAQALAPWVFHLNDHAAEQAPAAGVFRLNRRDLAPGIFHLNHHPIRQALAPGSFVSGLRLSSRNLRESDCPVLTDQPNFAHWGESTPPRSLARATDRAGLH